MNEEKEVSYNTLILREYIKRTNLSTRTPPAPW